jgi:hypothetical protein
VAVDYDMLLEDLRKMQAEKGSLSEEIPERIRQAMEKESAKTFEILIELVTSLKNSPDKPTYDQHLQTLESVFIERWNIIKGSSIDYCAHIAWPINKACELVATAFSKVEQPVCSFLMSDIQTAGENYPITAASHFNLQGDTEENKKFKAFNFFYHNGRLFDIENIISYGMLDSSKIFPVNDNESGKFNLNNKQLAIIEEIISGLDLEHNVFSNIRYIHYQTLLDSMGKRLNQLAEDLFRVSVNQDKGGTGTEYVAGAGYENFIIDFYNFWYKSLNEKQRQDYGALSYPCSPVAKSFPLESYLLRLFSTVPSCTLTHDQQVRVERDSIIPCANEIAKTLNLFNEKFSEKLFIPFEKNINHQEITKTSPDQYKNFTTALSHRKKQIINCDNYEFEKRFNLISDVIDSVKTAEEYLECMRKIISYKTLVSNMQNLDGFINQLKKDPKTETNYALFLELKNQEKLTNFIKSNPDKIPEILDLLNYSDRNKVLKFFNNETIRNYCNRGSNKVLKLFKSLSQGSTDNASNDSIIYIFNHIPDILKTVINDKDSIRECLSYIRYPEDQEKFTKILGDESINFMNEIFKEKEDKTFDDAVKSLKSLDKTLRLNFLKNTRSVSLLITSVNYLNNIISLLPEQDRTEYIIFIKKQWLEIVSENPLEYEYINFSSIKQTIKKISENTANVSNENLKKTYSNLMDIDLNLQLVSEKNPEIKSSMDNIAKKTEKFLTKSITADLKLNQIKEESKLYDRSCRADYISSSKFQLISDGITSLIESVGALIISKGLSIFETPAASRLSKNTFLKPIAELQKESANNVSRKYTEAFSFFNKATTKITEETLKNQSNIETNIKEVIDSIRPKSSKL